MSSRYNDIPLPLDEEALETLLQAGVEPQLSQHIASLFVRDPMVIFKEKAEQVDDSRSTEHFENIQSTNWR